jgi:hypothetical protein
MILNPAFRMGSCDLESPSGLTVQVNANGSTRRMKHRDILLNLFLGNEAEGGPANIYLRRLGDEAAAVPLLGTCSRSAVRCDKRSLTLSGDWRGIRFVVTMVLAESAPAWFWHVALENQSGKAETLDLIYIQDLALADKARCGLTNITSATTWIMLHCLIPNGACFSRLARTNTWAGVTPGARSVPWGVASVSRPMPCRSTASRRGQAQHPLR